MSARLSAVVVIAGAMTLAGAHSTEATVPPGFIEALVTGGLTNPTAMAFAPDGRLFVCQQGGQLRVIANGVLLPTPFVTVTVDPSGERGLLGVAFDPKFPENQYVYVYYTATTPSVHNRVSRFTANGNVAAVGSETILLELDNLSGATNHNGGAIHFAHDGTLFIAVGENATSSNAQSLDNLLGKMLRLNKDGTIPTDNPFYNQASGNNRAIWAMGLRNPFTFAFEPYSGRLFINDVGANTYEEVNDGIAGSNYGWPFSEGPTSDPRHRGPIYFYPHGNGTGAGCAITGGAFYNPQTWQFPTSYLGNYFFSDLCNGWINRFDPTSAPTDSPYVTASNFATGISQPVDLQVGPEGSLYYLARGSGSVYRISYTGTIAPVVWWHPQSRTVPSGQPVTFNVHASGSTPLSYQWQRNHVNIPGAISSTYTIGAVAPADDGALFRCLVSNSAGNALSNDAVLTVSGAPVPVVKPPTLRPKRRR